MSILRDSNKVEEDLQLELVNYGLARDAATKNAPGNSGSGAQYFGLSETPEEFKLLFTNDLRKLDNQSDPMQLAIIAPDFQPFDMLQSKDYTRGKRVKDESTIRRMLSNLLDTL